LVSPPGRPPMWAGTTVRRQAWTNVRARVRPSGEGGGLPGSRSPMTGFLADPHRTIDHWVGSRRERSRPRPAEIEPTARARTRQEVAVREDQETSARPRQRIPVPATRPHARPHPGLRVLARPAGPPPVPDDQPGYFPRGNVRPSPAFERRNPNSAQVPGRPTAQSTESRSRGRRVSAPRDIGAWSARARCGTAPSAERSRPASRPDLGSEGTSGPPGVARGAPPLGLAVAGTSPQPWFVPFRDRRPRSESGRSSRRNPTDVPGQSSEPREGSSRD